MDTPQTAAYQAALRCGCSVSLAGELAQAIQTRADEGKDDTNPAEIRRDLYWTHPLVSRSVRAEVALAWSSFGRKPVGDGTYQ